MREQGKYQGKSSNRSGGRDAEKSRSNGGGKDDARTGSYGRGRNAEKSRSNGEKGNTDKREGYGRERSVENSRGFEKNRNNAKGRAGASVCPYARRCGGCSMQGKEYSEQLLSKQKYVEEQLKGICKVEKICGMKNPKHYRNKVHAVFARERGKIISGIYQEGTHQVIAVDDCMIENETADAIIRDIKGLLPSFKIKTYDEDTGYGLLRHVLVRVGYHSKEVMVVLVLGSPILPSKNNFVKAIRQLHPEITTIILNVNGQRTSMVLGSKSTTIYGKGYIEDQLCGCTFRISPSSFYQVNPQQTEQLYEKAIALAALTGRERVIDAYCGTGTIGIVAAKSAGEVIGVELNRDAVRDAIANAKQNEIQNIQFYNADAGAFMVQMAEQNERADVVIMDPPRSGSTEEFIMALSRLKPDRIVYVSCNPETLARDLVLLQKKGYQAKEAWPFDLFPFTGHCEVITLLQRVGK